MSTLDLKRYVDERSPDEKRFLLTYIAEQLDPMNESRLREFDRRMDDLDAGKNRVDWVQATARLDKLDRKEK